MRTAVDSSVLLDIFSASEPFLKLSQDAVREALREGSLIASEVVWAEVSAHFESLDSFRGAMSKLGVEFVSSSAASAELAGKAWTQYRRSGGRREQLIPDFLVAAHAETHADRLLTRDRGFSKQYFANLSVWDPTAQ